MKFRNLDKIDISLYLIFEDIKKIMCEIKKDYGNEVFKSISESEFRKYIHDRYGV